MSWNLIDAIASTNQVDGRLVRPFGLSVKLGDVVQVQSNGNLSLQGSCRTLLGLNPTPARQGPPGDLFVQSAAGTSIAFRAAGTGSTLYPDLPSADACLDIQLANSQSWLLACRQRVLHTLTDQNRYREAILQSFQRGVWQKDWALVIEVGIVQQITLLAAQSQNTKLTLALSGQVASSAAMEAKLTSNASLVRTNSALVQWIMNEPSTAFCNAVRVKERWFSSPDVVPLESVEPAAGSLQAAPDADVWENISSK